VVESQWIELSTEEDCRRELGLSDLTNVHSARWSNFPTEHALSSYIAPACQQPCLWYGSTVLDRLMVDAVPESSTSAFPTRRILAIIGDKWTTSSLLACQSGNTDASTNCRSRSPIFQEDVDPELRQPRA